jgi:Protein of unknown function (DUF3795)
MDETISYCGLSCRTCPIYLASREGDELKKNDLRIGIIKECKKEYGIEYSIHDINDCDGCKSISGNLFSGCTYCKIRVCAIQKKIENCAYCDDYICDLLVEFFKSDRSAKQRLEKIHNSRDFT